jgi:hypothetical protein
LQDGADLTPAGLVFETVTQPIFEAFAAFDDQAFLDLLKNRFIQLDVRPLRSSQALSNFKKTRVGIGKNSVGHVPDHFVDRTGVESFLNKILDEEILAIVQICVHQNLSSNDHFNG